MLSDVPARWLAYQKTGNDKLFDAWVKVDRAVRDDAEEGWRLILELVALAAGNSEALSSIGAGPLEDLMRWHRTPYLDLSEGEAARNQPLADALHVARYPGHEF